MPLWWRVYVFCREYSITANNETHNAMTTFYNRTSFITFAELSDYQKQQVLENYFDSMEQAENASYVVFVQELFEPDEVIEDAIPVSMFMRSERDSTVAIYSTSAFDGFYLYIGKRGDEAVIAHRHF